MSAVRNPDESVRSIARVTAALPLKPRPSESSIAADAIVPIGLAMSLPGDIRRRAVDRLEQSGAVAETRRRQQAERSAHRAGFVRQDVAEHVLGEDHVEARRRERELHRRRVHDSCVSVTSGNSLATSVTTFARAATPRGHSPCRPTRAGCAAIAPARTRRAQRARSPSRVYRIVLTAADRPRRCRAARRSRARRSARGRPPGRCRRALLASAARRSRGPARRAPAAGSRYTPSSRRIAEQRRLRPLAAGRRRTPDRRRRRAGSRLRSCGRERVVGQRRQAALASAAPPISLVVERPVVAERVGDAIEDADRRGDDVRTDAVARQQNDARLHTPNP